MSLVTIVKFGLLTWVKLKDINNQTNLVLFLSLDEFHMLKSLFLFTDNTMRKSRLLKLVQLINPKSMAAGDILNGGCFYIAIRAYLHI